MGESVDGGEKSKTQNANSNVSMRCKTHYKINERFKFVFSFMND